MENNEEPPKATEGGNAESHLKNLAAEATGAIKQAGLKGGRAVVSDLMKIHRIRRAKRMKRLIVPMLILLAGFYLIISRHPKPTAQIAVRGEAEMVLVADEIYLSLILSDYYVEQEAGSLNVESYRTKGPELALIEIDAIERLKVAGLKPEEIRLVTAGQNSLYDNQSRSSRSYNFRQYEIKLNNFALADKLLKTELPYRVERFSIDRYSHSNLDVLKIEAQGLALANARQKADRLAAGYGNVKGLIFVGDEQSTIKMVQGQPGISPRAAKNMMADAPYSSPAIVADEPIIMLKEFTLKAVVDAIFAL